MSTSAGDEFGPYRINPAFDQFPEEARIVGKLLASFGEIEYSVCRNAGHATRLEESVIKALYRLRATSSRFEAADALAATPFAQAGFASEYKRAREMVQTCLRIRNQFAHCNWGTHGFSTEAGLFFTDLQAAADAPQGMEFAWRHVDVPLLRSHEAFFALTMEWLSFLDIELAIRTGALPPRSWPRPPEQAPPPFHNPPEMHVPPWLSEDQKALHIARARAASGGPPTPTPGHLAMEEGRKAARAKRQAARNQAVAPRSANAKPPDDPT